MKKTKARDPGYITVTELDHVRISNLLERQLRDGPATRASESLADALSQADQVEPQDMPTDVVTMRSRLRVQDPATGEARELTLCYPQDTDPNAGHVSVLSPIGASLLGARVGSTVQWLPPTGAPHALKIVELLFQPEANGQYTA